MPSRRAAVTSREIDAATRAVQQASELCARAQGRIGDGDTLTKGDDSPVTVADFAAQAVVTAVLVDALGPVEMVGEESSDDLAPGSSLRDGVVGLVTDQITGWTVDDSVDEQRIIDWVAAGASDATSERFWTLDPIDGTKGFLRGDHYAIALGLVDRGEVVLGVLGCPNLPNADGTRGATFVAAGGQCTAITPASPAGAIVGVASPTRLAESRLCESVESAHSDHGQARQIADLLGLAAEPYRIDSQCKYAIVARGDASIYLRLPTQAGYREKIWDHAAGKFVVEQAGGRVTDVDGNDLDFGWGRRLEHNRGVVASDGAFHDEILAAVRRVLD